MTLSDVLGQPVTELLARLIARDRLPHALLFEGLPGCGRRTVALALAQALLCPERRAGDACGECASCRLVVAGNHPDLVALPHDSESDELGAELVRTAVVEAATQSPLLGERRAFVLPGVERLHPAAVNALLKVLEEPPPGAYLVMTTANAKGLLPTIRSRVSLFRLAPLANDDVEQVLRRGGLDPVSARQRASLAAGSHRGLWQGQAAVPIAAMLRLCGEGLRTEWVAEVFAALPQRVRDDDGRSLVAEQRRILGHWLEALLQALRGGLRGAQAEHAAGAIERVLRLRHDLYLNLPPRLVIEGLALG
jgi:DNA polymerase III delta' subunit